MRQATGFTLVELLITLLIVAILAIYVAGRLDFITTFDQRGVRDKLVVALRYARVAAVAQRRPVCIEINGGNVSLSINPTAPENVAQVFGAACHYGTAFTTALNLPAPDRDCGNAHSVCSRTGATIGGGGSFVFDAQGRALTNTLAFTVTGQPDVTVEGDSGYVH